MHEASLMRDLMRQVLDLADRENARRVVGLTVRLGALSHMSPDHFREHFAVAARDTLAAGAAIETIVADDIRAPDAADIRIEAIEVE